ncbi:MAG: DUF971 domain-containing protein [Chlorobi bacterium]|nr:DUF971 domain-containing protein [Chlorobiota bacterium]
MYPKEIDIINEGNGLRILWNDNRVSMIPARELRNACGCVECQSMRSKGNRLSLALLRDSANRIRSVDLPSSSKLLVTWRDGHNRSFYSFSNVLETFPPN